MKEDGFIEREGFKLHYSIQGEGLATIVVGSALYYPRTFSQQLRQKLQLVFMDHRGFAIAPENFDKGAFQLDLLLEDIEAVRQHLNLGKIIIVGHSGHGYMALEYAKKYPQHVSHVVLIAMGPSQSVHNHQLAQEYFYHLVDPLRKQILSHDLAKLEQHLIENPNDRFITFCLALKAKSWFNPNFDASSLWKDVHSNDLMFDYVWGEIFRDIDITKDIEKINAPIFLALGLHDYLVAPFYTWQPLLSLFNKITLKLFQNSAHTPQYEEAKEFDKELLSWLEEPYS